jgi:hypothetical protein
MSVTTTATVPSRSEHGPVESGDLNTRGRNSLDSVGRRRKSSSGRDRTYALQWQGRLGHRPLQQRPRRPLRSSSSLPRMEYNPCHGPSLCSAIVAGIPIVGFYRTFRSFGAQPQEAI